MSDKIPVVPAGGRAETPALMPSHPLMRDCRPSIARKAAAARAARELFRFCELPDKADKGDAEAFLAAAIAILAEFAPETMAAVVDPVHGLPSRFRRPHLSDIRAACEDAYAPVGRDLARREGLAEQQRRRLAAAAEEGLKPEIAELLAKVKKIDPAGDADLKGHKRDDPDEATRQSVLDLEDRAKTDRMILREYIQLGQPPVFASPGLVVSPSLVRLIKGTRSGHTL